MRSVIMNVNVAKYYVATCRKNVKDIKFVANRCVRSSSKYTPKLVFGRGGAPDPAEEAYDDP